ncbi:hypothetical protein SAMN05444162_0413 [Paenibacillaceae bacterium GAS479]|nr:hypothetical protein SAMN05444162_0413 [Paenibacillaceae bacterium GAS479]
MSLFYVSLFVTTMWLAATDNMIYAWIIIALLFPVSFAFIIFNSLKFNRLFLAGKTEEAFQELDKQENKFLNKPKALNQIRVTRASLLSNIGEFAASNALLESIPGKLDPNLEAMRQGLLGFNYYMSGSRMSEASDLIRQSLRSLNQWGSYLILAAVERELGNEEASRQALDTYLDKRKQNVSFVLGKTLILYNKKLLNELEEYLLGRYYLAGYEEETAYTHFAAAAALPSNGPYARLSKEMLEQLSLSTTSAIR